MTNRQDDSGALREVVKRLRVLAVAISLPQRRNRKDELRWSQALMVDADDIEAALSPQGSEPAGVGDWVLVPREPTELMVCHGFEAAFDREESLHPNIKGTCKGAAEIARATYAAMLAATPAPAQQAVTEQDGAQGGEAVLYAAAEKGFHISETCGPDGKYWHVSKFQSLADLQAYEHAWRQVMLAARDMPASRPAIAPQATPAAVDEHVRRQVGRLAQWRLCMSHNESYFGEPAGLLKSVTDELVHAVDPIYPPIAPPADPLAGVTIYTAALAAPPAEVKP